MRFEVHDDFKNEYVEFNTNDHPLVILCGEKKYYPLDRIALERISEKVLKNPLQDVLILNWSNCLNGTRKQNLIQILSLQHLCNVLASRPGNEFLLLMDRLEQKIKIDSLGFLEPEFKKLLDNRHENGLSVIIGCPVTPSFVGAYTLGKFTEAEYVYYQTGLPYANGKGTFDFSSSCVLETMAELNLRFSMSKSIVVEEFLREQFNLVAADRAVNEIDGRWATFDSSSGVLYMENYRRFKKGIVKWLKGEVHDESLFIRSVPPEGLNQLEVNIVLLDEKGIFSCLNDGNEIEHPEVVGIRHFWTHLSKSTRDSIFERGYSGSLKREILEELAKSQQRDDLRKQFSEIGRIRKVLLT